MLLAAKHVHVFVWVPKMGADSAGVTVRFRWRGGWTHVRLILFQRNPFPRQNRNRMRPGTYKARRTCTLLELSSWRTAPGTVDRVGLKSYLRVKASPGGTEVPA